MTMSNFRRLLFVFVVITSILHAGEVKEKCFYNVLWDKTNLSIHNHVIASVVSVNLKYIKRDDTIQRILKISTQFADYNFHYFSKNDKFTLYIYEKYDYGRSRMDGTYKEGRYTSKKIEEVLALQNLAISIKESNIEIKPLEMNRLNELINDVDILNRYLNTNKHSSCDDW